MKTTLINKTFLIKQIGNQESIFQDNISNISRKRSSSLSRTVLNDSLWFLSLSKEAQREESIERYLSNLKNNNLDSLSTLRFARNVSSIVIPSLARNLILSLALTLFSINLFALPQGQNQIQQQKNDSLLAIYNNKSENDSVRLDAFYKYAYDIRYENPDTTLLLANELFESLNLLGAASQKNHFLGLYHKLTGISYAILGDYKSALGHFKQRLNISNEFKSGLDQRYDARYDLGLLHYKLFEYEEAKIYLKQSISDTRNLTKVKLKKIGAYDLLGMIDTYQGKYDSALFYYHEALDINEELGEEVGISDSYIKIGLVHSNKGNYEKAIHFLQKSLQLAEKNSDDQLIAIAYNNIGDICYDQGNYPKALEYYQKSLKLQTALNDKVEIAKLNSNIGYIYSHQEEYEEALKHHEESLALFQEMGEKNGISYTLSAIATEYANQKKYDEALIYYKKGIEQSSEIGDLSGIAGDYNNIGQLFYDKNDFTKAKEYYLKSLKIREEIGEQHGVSSSYIGIGEVSNQLREYQSGISWCKKGLKLAKEMEVLEEQQFAYGCLADAYEALGDYKKVYDYNSKYYELNDSIFNEEKTKELTRLEMNYSFEQEQDSLDAVQREIDLKNEAKLQKAEATRNYSIGGLSAAVILAFVMYSRFKVSREKNKIIQAEKDRSEELLLNILPEETALELKEKGVVQAQHHDEVTVLFADITNFTQLSERTPPQELVATIHTYFSAFDQIMEKHGIEKIKTIGDAYMAAAGLHNKPEQAKRMVLAAQEMLEYVRKNPLSNDINFRVGIHTGPVVSGVVGVKKFAYDIWGDTVNTAARMESASEPGKINISEATQQKIKDYFEHTSRGKVAIKGKGEMEMFFVNV